MGHFKRDAAPIEKESWNNYIDVEGHVQSGKNWQLQNVFIKEYNTLNKVHIFAIVLGMCVCVRACEYECWSVSVKE